MTDGFWSGLTFQQHPAPLLLDGVAELHSDLFPLLERLSDPAERARQFMDYMTVHFRLEALEDAGLIPAPSGYGITLEQAQVAGTRGLLRMVRGWAN